MKKTYSFYDYFLVNDDYVMSADDFNSAFGELHNWLVTHVGEDLGKMVKYYGLQGEGWRMYFTVVGWKFEIDDQKDQTLFELTFNKHDRNQTSKAY